MNREGLLRWKLAEIRRQDEKCPLCQQPYSKKRPPTIDHIVPKVMGGSLAEDNRRIICKVCNEQKDNHPVWNPNHPHQDEAPPGMPLPPWLPEFSFPPPLLVQHGVLHPQPPHSPRPSYWKGISQLVAAVNAMKAGKEVHLCKYDVRPRLNDLVSALPILVDIGATWNGPDGLQFRFTGGYLLTWWPNKGTLLWQKKLPRGTNNSGDRMRTLTDELRKRKNELLAAKEKP